MAASEAEKKAKKKYRNKNKNKYNYWECKSKAKKFIMELATEADLVYLENLIKKRINIQ